MKLSTALLAGSLGVNATLLVFLVAGTSGKNTSSAATGVVSAQPAAAGKSAAGDANAAATRAAWDSLKPENPTALRDRLRAEGFPPEMIRALVAEQIRLQFAGRRAALTLKANERPFWEATTPDSKTAAALAQLTKEQNQALKDVLGPDAMLDDIQATNLRRQFPNLSAEKIAGLLETQRTLNEKTQEILESGTFASADLNQLQNQRRAEIAKLLTPQELEDYELRTGTTANTLRRQLAAFNPTEQEFRTLYDLQKNFDDRYQTLTIAGLAPDQQSQVLRERAEAQKQLTEQMKANLGDERYAEYLRSGDNNYQQTIKLIARLELPPETANQVYVVQQDLQSRARTVQSDTSLTLTDRNAYLSTLATEAESKITATLGPRGYEAYKQYGGSWLQQLQPRVIATRPAIAAPAGGRGGGG